MVERRSEPLQNEPPSERVFRIRHLLLLTLMAGLLYWMYPRARAAFELHSAATAAADYGSCMVGPTGASALRDHPDEFAMLVRRRLIAAGDDDFPFADCAALAREVSGSVEVARAHRARAADFLEYGAPVGTAHHSLSQLSLGLARLARLAKQSWPLERRGWAHLVVPSSHVKEAPHPVPPNAPAVGRGLPGWRSAYAASWIRDDRRFLAVGHSSNLAVYESKDGGRNWQSSSLAQPGVAEHAGRCVAADAEQSFTFELTESGLLVSSLALDHVVFKTRIEGARDVLASSCDERSMLLAVLRDDQRQLIVCAHAGRCGQVSHRADWLDAHFDIARVEGTSVIATARDGIVRVRSTRDEGKTWTPDTVAFDWAAQTMTSDVKVPSRLLVTGKELWLYGAAQPGRTYPVLFSVDVGTSWYAPRAGAAGVPLQALR